MKDCKSLQQKLLKQHLTNTFCDDTVNVMRVITMLCLDIQKTTKKTTDDKRLSLTLDIAVNTQINVLRSFNCIHS